MYFLLLGLILAGGKYLEMGPMTAWPWWVVLAPFGLAVAWWTFADASGYTKRKAMEKMDKVKRERLQKQREAIGLAPRHC